MATCISTTESQRVCLLCPWFDWLGFLARFVWSRSCRVRGATRSTRALMPPSAVTTSISLRYIAKTRPLFRSLNRVPCTRQQILCQNWHRLLKKYLVDATGCPSAKNLSIVGHRIWTQNPRQPGQSFPGKTDYFAGKALPGCLGFCVQILCPTIDSFWADGPTFF